MHNNELSNAVKNLAELFAAIPDDQLNNARTQELKKALETVR